MHDGIAMPVGSNHQSLEQDQFLKLQHIKYQGRAGWRITSAFDIPPNLIETDCDPMTPEMLTLNQSQIDSIVRTVSSSCICYSELVLSTALRKVNHAR